MSFQKLVAYSASNTADGFIKIKDRMLLMGWTMHDDQSGGGTPYYILKSYGEDSTSTLAPAYIKISHDTVDYIDIRLYLYWNNSTHTGGVEVGNYTAYRLNGDDDDIFYLWIYGNKDWFVIVTKLSSTSYYGMYFTKATFFKDHNGILQSNSGIGTDKVLQLGSGEASDFITGSKVAIICIDGTTGRQYDLTISDVDRDNDTITISTNISYDFPAGSIVGYQPFPWVIGPASSYTSNYFLQGSGTSTSTSASYRYSILSYSDFDPDAFSNVNGILPFSVRYSSTSGFGAILNGDFFRDVEESSTYESLLCSNKRDSGTVTSSSSNTIDSTGHNWITNEFVGKAIAISGGVGIGQTRDIISNTDEQIVVDVNWSIIPSINDNFVISDRVYRRFGWGSHKNFSILESGD